MDVHSEGRCDADPHVVWSELSAVETWPGWTPTVTSVTREGIVNDGSAAPDDTGVGSRFLMTQPRLGRAS